MYLSSFQNKSDAKMQIPIRFVDFLFGVMRIFLCLPTKGGENAPFILVFDRWKNNILDLLKIYQYFPKKVCSIFIILKKNRIFMFKLTPEKQLIAFSE